MTLKIYVRYVNNTFNVTANSKFFFLQKCERQAIATGRNIAQKKRVVPAETDVHTTDKATADELVLTGLVMDCILLFKLYNTSTNNNVV